MVPGGGRRFLMREVPLFHPMEAPGPSPLFAECEGGVGSLRLTARLTPLSSELGIYETVKARSWPLLSGKRP